MTGIDTAEKIWNYLTGNGMTQAGAAGMMGNIKAESGMAPNRVEILCLKRLAEAGKLYTDATYTAFVDDGTIARDEFLNPLPGKQYGYGLVQWTSPNRKAGLYDLAKRRKVSIADLEMQLDYLMEELRTSYSSVLSILKSATSVQVASDYVLKNFEQPADCGSVVRTYRAKLGQVFYDRFAGKGKSMDAVDKLISVAKAEVGYLEKKGNSNLDDKTANAGSANYTKYWRDVYPAYQGQAWCACFVSWCFMEAFGLDMAKKLLKHWPYVYCPTLGDLFTRYANPQVGDIVIFYRNGTFAHTGIVIKVEGDSFWTIEGNASGASGITENGGGVVMKSYYNSQLPGTKFCRPDYGLMTGNSAVISIKKGDDYMFEVGAVQNGSKGKDVKLLQILLNAHGANLSVDGDCGAKTVEAIKKYQKDFGLVQDGIVGPKTWASVLMRE